MFTTSFKQENIQVRLTTAIIQALKMTCKSNTLLMNKNTYYGPSPRLYIILPIL